MTITVQDIIHKKPHDKIAIGNFILEQFLNKNFNDIVNIVNSLPHINGDLRLIKDDNINVTLFWLAVLMNDASLVSILSDRGDCNVDILGTYKSRKFFRATPLSVACAFGREYMNVITTLLEKCKADVNITDNDGYTPLIRMTTTLLNPREAIDISNILIFYGANINYAIPDSGNTALHCALEQGNNNNTNNHYEYAKYLITRGADPINIKNATNVNALIKFAIYVAKQHDEYLDDDDGKEEEFEAKKVNLTTFIKALKKNCYFKEDEDDIETLFRLFGAAYSPFIIKYKKFFWLNAINPHQRKKQKPLNYLYNDDDFLNIVGEDKCEFQTIEDLNLIESIIDCLIQSIFIFQRILGPKHDLTIELLQDLCLEYKGNHQEDKYNLLRQYLGYGVKKRRF